MKKDLYKVLNTKKNAKAETLKMAYRKRALETHPDRGGDAEEFALVKQAWDVLSVPSRRDRYDSTGEYEEKPIDNSESKAVQILAAIFQQVLAKMNQQNAEPSQNDVIGFITQVLDDAIRKMMEDDRLFKKKLKWLEKFDGRFESKSGSSFFETMVNQQKSHLEKNLEEISKALVEHESAKELLKLQSYRFDKVEKQAFTSGIPLVEWTVIR